MSRVLLGALAMGAFILLTSFALRDRPTTKVPGGPAWRVSDYQMDRAFRIPTYVPLGGSLTGQVPLNGGFILTQVRANGNTGGGILSIAINGVSEGFELGWNTGSPTFFDLNPPIIARPNDVVTISTTAGNGNWIFAGYTTYSGET